MKHIPYRAFTLIELLVVITIIVILLAMLTPALDRAIYQAELVVCATQLDAITTGVTAYAVEQRRYYPYRPSARNDNNSLTGSQPLHVTTRTGRDDRTILRQAFDLDLLIDPLCEPISIKPEDNEPYDPEVIFHASYAMYFGYRYG